MSGQDLGSGDGRGKDGWVWRGTARGFHLKGAVFSMINVWKIPKNGIAGSKGKQSLHFVTYCKLLSTKVLRIYRLIKGSGGVVVKSW